MTLLDQGARRWTLATGARYFGGSTAPAVAIGAVATATRPAHALAQVALPEWAADLGVGSPPALLVDAACVTEGPGPAWRRCDWVAAAYLHLSGWLERDHEARLGPTHSYAARLPGKVAAAFDHAWVNRIFLLLRRAAARASAGEEERLFGPLPPARIVVTHDLDYVAKTVPLRLKNGAFALVNALRGGGAGECGRALRLLFGDEPYDRIEVLHAIDRAHGVAAVWHVHARAPGPRGPRCWLFDPGYRLTPELCRRLLKLADEGGTLGLHPGVAAWRDADAIGGERARLEAALGCAVRHCRQHWLRFSWRDTWRAQAAAGLAFDSTLGFNDRPGFRNGAALAFAPWEAEAGRPLALEVLPMLMMDSHLFAYRRLDAAGRRAEIARWFGEVRAVAGEAAINVHPHGLTEEFGWHEGYLDMLAALP